MTAPAARYAKVAIVLHWLIAAAILAMIPVGLWMAHGIETPGQRELAFAAYKLHKSVGLTILALSLARLAWRLAHKPPPFPAAMPGWEKAAALATHWAFYVLIIAIPLTGWLFISTNWSVQYNRPFDIPTLYFNTFRVPELPFFGGADNAARKAAAETLLDWHRALALTMLALVALHIGAALKHQFADRDETFAHMAPTPKALPLQAIAIATLAGVLMATAFVLALQPRAHNRDGAPTTVAAPAPSVAPQPVAVSAAPAPTPTQASATPWKVDAAASKITFSGAAPSGPFTGTFKSWRGDIRFSPDDLAHSRAIITLAMAQAQIPDAAGTAMLKQDLWFDVANFPTATFTTSTIKSLGPDRYETTGLLKIRDKTAPITLPFTLKIDGDVATMDGRVSIERLRWDIGKSWPTDPQTSGWASATITVNVHIRATRAP